MAGQAGPDRVAEVCELLQARVADLALDIARGLQQQEPLYAELIEIGELASAVRPNVILLLEAMGTAMGKAMGAAESTDELPSSSSPHATGLRRAEQGMPLSMVLAGYRLGALRVWEELVSGCLQLDGAGDGVGTAGRQLLESASLLWSIVDDHTQDVTAAYREFEREQVDRDHRRRQAMVGELLRGSTTGSNPADTAVRLGLPTTGPYVVVVLDAGPREADAVGEVHRDLDSAGVASAWRSDVDTFVVVVATRTGAGSGSDALTRALCARITGSTRIGVSEPAAQLTDVPTALGQAVIAHGTARAGHGPTRFADALSAAVVAGSPLADRLRRHTWAGLDGLPADDRRMLLATLRAWYDHGGSAERAGAGLHCHPNTVRHRLAKLSVLTGRDLKVPVDVAHLHLALEAERLHAPTGRVVAHDKDRRSPL